jgi:hypothetical protein
LVQSGLGLIRRDLLLWHAAALADKTSCAMQRLHAGTIACHHLWRWS